MPEIDLDEAIYPFLGPNKSSDDVEKAKPAPERARHFARCWNAEFVDVGTQGHINAASGLEDWAFGKFLLSQLLTPQLSNPSNSAAQRNDAAGVASSGEVPRFTHGRGLRL